MAHSEAWTARSLLLVALGSVAACMLVPYGEWLIYPFQLFGTFVHEAGHALAALFTGGRVESFVVNLDTSGYVRSRGGSRIFTASAGYPASALAGAALLYAGTRRRWATPTLVGTALATVLITALFSGYGASWLAFATFVAGCAALGYGRKRSRAGGSGVIWYLTGLLAIAGALAYMLVTSGLVAWAVGLSMAAVLLLVAMYAAPVVQHLTVLFLGAQLALDGLHSIQTLFSMTRMGHAHNDAATMAQLTGIPASVWAIGWGLLSVLVVGWAIVLFWRIKSPSDRPIPRE